ncbi:ABC transporter permease [Paenibacillus sp. MMS18-CY102]|uniref:ABC transporter permease n=1 Tax=Paenibacillus sp. MMS18-CY102 TaxID=2682849 RepID=UPI00136626AF|nr:ABC transporter permease subunit [Paenibacillus sp. MMS18-CY102]MWC30233.1 ABC transporter permease subunit [Paenibacillus sp. MMS18-CY102]
MPDMAKQPDVVMDPGGKISPAIKKNKSVIKSLVMSWQLYAMVLPAVIMTLLFAYVPLLYSVIAFQNFKPYHTMNHVFFHADWVGLKHFKYAFSLDAAKQAMVNTAVLFVLKVIGNTIAPLIFALLLNEIRREGIKRSIQTLVYLPHFMSWVILGGILIDVLGQQGVVNVMLGRLFGADPVPFLLNGDWYRAVIVVSDMWKEFGFGAIVFLATLAGINPALYEASEVDGATRWKQTLYVTIPSMLPITLVVLTLTIAGVLGYGLFEQIFNTYNGLVYDKGDVIDTFVFRIGIQTGQFSFATAVGLFKSFIGLILVVIGYRLAYKYANYKIF